MRIIALSDSHFRSGISKIPTDFWTCLNGCDLILHAGDVGDISFLEDLRSFAPVEAVCGNNDVPNPPYLPYKKVLLLEGHAIGIAHGHQVRNPEGMLAPGFFAEEVDMVIFGHSHVPYFENIEGKLLLNPGAIMRPRCGNSKSCAELRIEKNKMINVQMFYFF